MKTIVLWLIGIAASLVILRALIGMFTSIVALKATLDFIAGPEFAEALSSKLNGAEIPHPVDIARAV